MYYYKCYQDNVDLQLEAAYRKRLVEVHQAVKRRLVSKKDSLKLKIAAEYIVGSPAENCILKFNTIRTSLGVCSHHFTNRVTKLHFMC